MSTTAVKTISVITLLSIINLIAGVFYSLLQVRIFGTDRVIEIFFAAQSLVYLVTSLSQSGQISEIFLPIYLTLKNSYNQKVANKAFSLMLNRMVLYTLIIIILIYFASPFIIKLFIPGFSSADQAQATLLFRAFLPLILLQISSSFLNTILNAESIYGRVELTAFLSVLLSILLLWGFYAQFGIWVLLFVSYFGVSMQIITSIIFIFRKKIQYSLVLNMTEFDHKPLFRTFYSTIRYSLSTQLLNWALTSSLSFFPPGVYALYSYVNMILTKVTNVFVQPLSIIFFTKISSYINDRKKVNDLFDKAQQFGFYIGFTFFVFLLVNGKEFLTIFLGQKKFTPSDVQQAYYILIPLSVSFIFQNWFSLNRKIAVSFGKAKSLYNVLTLMMIGSALLTYGLIYFFSFNGLIISILITKILFLVSPFIVNKMNDHVKMDFSYLTRLIFISCFIISFAFLIKNGLPVDVTHPLIQLIISIGITILIGGISVYLFAKKDFSHVLRMIRKGN